MSSDSYSVRVNRRDGVVEIVGPDKEWIATQLDRLAVVYTQDLLDVAGAGAAGDALEAGAVASGGGGNAAARRRRSSRRVGAPRTPRDSQLEPKLTKDVLRRMHTYFQERPRASANHQNRAAVIATFLADELREDGLRAADLIVVYRAMGWPPPKNPAAVIRNAIDRNQYFSGVRDGKVHLTPTGEHFGRHAAKEAGSD